MATLGQIDLIAYSPANAGWLIAGWLPVSSQLAAGLPTATVFADVLTRSGSSKHPLMLAFHPRADLGERGIGIVGLLKGGAELDDALSQISIRFGRTSFRVDQVPGCVRPSEIEMLQHCRSLLREAVGGRVAELVSALSADPYSGVSTFEALVDFVRVGVDELIVLRPNGAVIFGWMLAWPGTITSLAVCSEASQTEIQPSRMVAIQRADVLEAGGRDRGFEDPFCGFVAYVEGKIPARGPAWLKIVTEGGRVGYATIPDHRIRGMRAIRRILEVVDVQADDVRRVFDMIVGPACQSLNAERLSLPLTYTTVVFGTRAPMSRGTIVIPLFNIIDYLEHQIAALAAMTSIRPRWDIVYVLDDPPRRQAVLDLAETVYARFQIPFTVVLMGENRGFAAACNVGLQAATGGYVCFLNSDVLPITADFADHLADRLESTAELGIVGGLLLFEDGSVQHEGMRMQPVRSQGGLEYPVHMRKGLRPRKAGLELCDMVTGACMVMRRTLADRLGGFDEGFIIGDFEDADLCVRVRAEGLSIAVDHSVRLFHLERQSQVGPDQRWRSNMTTYNAWRFDHRQRHPATKLI